MRQSPVRCAVHNTSQVQITTCCIALLLLVSACQIDRPLYSSEIKDSRASEQSQPGNSNAALSDTASFEADDAKDDDDPLKIRITIAERPFSLEVAADTPSRTKGLAGRTELKANEGMIFAYPTGTERLSFWMKDCLIDIDIMYLSSRGRIVSMHEMKKQPPRQPDETELDYEFRLKRYPSERPAQYAVELKSGMIRKLDVSVGDFIEFDRAFLAALARENVKKEQQQRIQR